MFVSSLTRRKDEELIQMHKHSQECSVLLCEGCEQKRASTISQGLIGRCPSFLVFKESLMCATFRSHFVDAKQSEKL